MICHSCYIGSVVPTAMPGRTLRYKTLKSLPVPADLMIPTCDHCGDQWLSPADAKRTDAAMEAVYRCDLIRRAQAVLPPPHESERVERDLGLSRGYLSRLRKGTKVPSEPLLALLALIHRKPSVLKQVEAIWAEVG